jgi:hypothetical protein
MKNYFAGFGLALLGSVVLAAIGYVLPVHGGRNSDADLILLGVMQILIPVTSFVLAGLLRNKYSKQFFGGILTVAIIEIPLFIAGVLLLNCILQSY